MSKQVWVTIGFSIDDRPDNAGKCAIIHVIDPEEK